MSLNQLMPYREAATLLQQYSIPLPPYHLVRTAEEAVTAARSLGFPVAVKAISPDLSHKSDMGLVRLGLGTPESVGETAAALLAAADWSHWPSMPAGQRQGIHRLEGLLIQKMVAPGVEMIIGIHEDPQFGPIIALGSGGVLVELLDDIVLRLPPFTRQEALTIIRETKSWRLLQGFRHYLPADTPALAQLLVDISRLAVSEEGRISGLDLNPVIVLPEGQGVGIVDLRIEVPGT